jgi:hypothetical protein
LPRGIFLTAARIRALSAEGALATFAILFVVDGCRSAVLRRFGVFFLRALLLLFFIPTRISGGNAEGQPAKVAPFAGGNEAAV